MHVTVSHEFTSIRAFCISFFSVACLFHCNIQTKIQMEFALYFFLNQVAWVVEALEVNKVLLDASRTDEPIEEANRARLVVGSTRASTTEWLLTYDGASTLIIVVYVARCMTQAIRCGNQCLTVSREAKSIVSP
jgi:hypothetical protein